MDRFGPGGETGVIRIPAGKTRIHRATLYLHDLCKEQTRRMNSVSYVPSLTVIAGWNPQ